MITRIPALEYLGRSVGTYQDSDGLTKLVLSRVGYGFSVHLNGARGTSFAGLIGAAGERLELHALIGLANVLTFSWQHSFAAIPNGTEVQMQFAAAKEDPDLMVTLAFNGPVLKVEFGLNGSPKKTYSLRIGAQPTLQADAAAQRGLI